MRTSSPRKHAAGGLLARLDRAAGEVNAFLLILALGLGVLDLTCLWVLKVEDALPRITRIHDAPNAPSVAPASAPKQP
jgi:hypothetical protein